MSFQRVLETARRHGMPVIVTDPAGREPMVLLSLAAYEAITQTGALTPIHRPTQEERSVKIAVQSEEKLKKSPTLASFETIPSMTEQEMGQGMSLEERFYLEPVDEESAT